MTSSSTTQQKHHHRPSSSLGKQFNKKFKGSNKKGLKQRQKGKTSDESAIVVKKTSTINTSGLTKKERKGQSKLLMQQKNQQRQTTRSLFSSSNSPSNPSCTLHRQILVVALTDSVDFELMSSLLGHHYVEKQALHIHTLNQKDAIRNALSEELTDWLIKGTLADTVVFVVSAKDSESGVNKFGADCLRALRAQGISSCCAAILHLNPVDSNKKNNDLKTEWLKVLTGELPFLHSKLFDPTTELNVMLRFLANMSLSGISWRESRPYLIVDDIQTNPNINQSNNEDAMITVKGFSRGNMSFVPGQWVHLPGVGDFKIHSLKIDGTCISSIDLDDHDEGVSFYTPPKMNESDLGYPSDINNTSCSSLSSESESNEITQDNTTEKRVTFDMELDDEEGEEDSHITKTECTEHKKKSRPWLTDEFEVPEDQTARECLRQYRAVKSLRTSEWTDDQSLPEEYTTLVSFQDYKHSRKLALNTNNNQTTNTAGKYIEISLATSMMKIDKMPLVIWGLLRHEEKPTLVHAVVKLCNNIPLKRSESYIVQCGFRRMLVKPLFSTYEPTFKLQRAIKDFSIDPDVQAGHLFTMTWHGPISYDPMPLLVFNPLDNEMTMTGSIHPLEHNLNRVVLERVTLTGQPFKIHRRTAVVRFMFDNPQDVRYFKPVELISRFGRRGVIIESLGTHGYMKCTFDSHRSASTNKSGSSSSSALHPHDTIMMHLYKRIHPSFNTTKYIH